jgi:hypothetical protein
MEDLMMFDDSIIKEKRPDLIMLNRNSDGTYEVRYSGIAYVNSENIIKSGELIIPRCKIKWDDKLFIPWAGMEEILISDDGKNELLRIIEA